MNTHVWTTATRCRVIYLMILLGGVAAQSTTAGVLAVGGYFSDDGYQHAISVTNDGAVHEVYFDPQKGTNLAELGCYGEIIAAGAFYSSDDNTQHVVVAASDGNVREIFFNPGIGVHTTNPPLANIPGLVGLAAFYAKDDGNRIVITADRNGEIHEIFYHPSRGVSGVGPPLMTIPDIVSIGAFYSDDDHFRHVIVATRNGDIREIFYSPTIGAHLSQPALAHFPGVVSVTGFYTPDDKTRHVIVATQDGGVHEVFYNPTIGVHTSEPALATVPGVTSVAAYYTAAGTFRHVIAGTKDGQLRELFFRPSTGLGNDLLSSYGDLGITAVEINQATQDLRNRIPLFFGKRTLVRTYLNAGRCVSTGPSISNARISAQVFAANNMSSPVWGPVTIGPVSLPRAADRSQLSNSVNFELPIFGPSNGKVWSTTSGYVLRITSMPQGGTGETRDTPLRFYQSVPLHVQLVYQPTTTGTTTPRSVVDQILTRITAFYPISTIVVHDTGVLGPSTGIGWDFIEALQKSFENANASAPTNVPPPNCSTCKFLGVLPQCTPYWCGLAAACDGGGALAAVSGDNINGSSGTAGQELAHLLCRLHASAAHGEASSDPSFPYSHGQISDDIVDSPAPSLVSNGHYMGADPGTNPANSGASWTIIPVDAGGGRHHHDFMSYGGGSDIWTSDYTYRALCRANIEGHFDTAYNTATAISDQLPPATLCQEIPTVTPFSARVTLDAPLKDAMLLRGVVHDGTSVEFHPLVAFRTRQLRVDESHQHGSVYEVRVLDAEGHELDRKPIAPAAHTDSKTFPFVLELAAAPSVTTFVIANGEGREIGRLNRRKGTPTARFIVLPHGTLAEKSAISWRVSHPDGQGGLTSTVEYSPDGGHIWQILAMDLTKTTLTITPQMEATMAGGKLGRFRLVVSDGMNDSTVDGPADLVVRSKPPQIFIVEPRNEEHVVAGARLALRGSALSPQSGLLPDSAFHWFAGEREIGVGSMIEARGLHPGSNEIQLRVRDAEGRQSVETRSVTLDAGSLAAMEESRDMQLPTLLR